MQRYASRRTASPICRIMLAPYPKKKGTMKIAGFIAKTTGVLIMFAIATLLMLGV